MHKNKKLRYAVVVSLSCLASAAMAQTAAPKGQRALLTLNVQVDGTAEVHSRANGIDLTWKTNRTFDAKFEMTADAASSAGQTPAAQAALQPNNDMMAIQKKIEACGDNQACQMAVAAEMMQSKDVQAQIKKASSGEVRYQTWRVVENSARNEVKASYREDFDGVFLTATREESKCQFVGPVLTGGALSAKDRETLLLGTRGIAVEIDLQAKTSQVLLSLVGQLQGDGQCTESIGSKSTQHRQSKSVAILPRAKKDNQGWVDGGIASAAVLARGENTFEMERGSTAVGSNLPDKPPLKVKVRWELTKL